MKLRPLNKIWPGDNMERMLVSACLGLIPGAYYILIIKVLPELLDYGSAGYIFLQLLGMFLFSNLMSNFIMCVLVDPSIDPSTMGSPLEREKQPREWHECKKCDIWAPPRSHHCKICDVCVLKRDHHCNFTGCCVGHANYRYFFYFVIYMLISSLVAFIASLVFVYFLRGGSYKFVLLPFANGLYDVREVFNEKGELNVKELLKSVIPSQFEMVFAVLFGLNWVVLFSTICFLYQRWPILISGVTWYELRTKNFNYDRGLRLNLQMIFGSRMSLSWISPFISSPLPHDGIHWMSEDKDAGDGN
ncbi:probable palmitoyltransferase ZDHHC24 [Drosophila kikkawai]|uniref:Palmitoyltransferase n=1 Tax=Drosophila kikkawai TaxID=30033 RepID=A0A6P4IAA2_DROKI|nr:probable palmitoyltransferase ZDHHC24 [Drosophila kikkawai]